MFPAQNDKINQMVYEDVEDCEDYDDCEYYEDDKD